MFLSYVGFAQVNTYGFSETNSAYSALTTPTIAIAAPWDDNVTLSIPIGFTFRYNGVNQTQCFISSNGFISFGVAPTTLNYLPLSDPTIFTNGGTISALGMDLISGVATDNIVYSTSGAVGSRVFVVQWTNARRKAISGNFNFQIRLTETTNTIEFSYGVCAPDTTSVLNTQVGIRGETNNFLQGDVKNRLQNGVNVNFTWFAKTIEGVANSNTVRTSITEYPNIGLKYTFTPSVNCLIPTAASSNLVIGATSVSTTSFVGNSFTAAVPAPTNYLILSSLVNTPPTSVNISNRVYWAVNDFISGIYTVVSVSNATAFAQTALIPNTNYYYWVIPYNSGCLGGPFYNISGMISASKTTCISEPSGLIASTIEGNSFTASWNPVLGATDYRLDVSTTSNFSTIIPGYNNVSSSALNIMAVNGLIPFTTYYFRVRAIGIGCNVNSTSATVTTTCGSYPIPYFQNFDTTTVATIPTCFTITNNNSDGVVWQVQNSIAASIPNAIHLATNSPIDSDDWFFTPGLNLSAGVSYRLKFKYNTTSAGIFAENLRVRLGTGPSEPNMNITILDLPNLINTVYQTATIDFTPVTNDVYYIGFQGYSFANQSKIVVDDISIIVSPTCFEPNNVNVTSVGSTTATISWDAPFPAPANGYQYYVNTTNTQPSLSAIPSGSVAVGIVTTTIIGLTPATLYYVWVRGNCDPTDKSVWSLIQSFSTDCSTATLLAVVNGTLCGGGSTTLQATSNPGSTIEWFSDSGGTILLATGNNYVTPTLFSTRTYYAQSRAAGGLVTVGPNSPIAQGGFIGTGQVQTSVNFSVSTATSLQSIDIYPLVSGQNGIFTIRNIANVVLATYAYTTNVAGGSTPQTIALGINLAVGNYFLYMDTLPANGLVTNINNATYPYTSSVANITGNGYDNTFYMYAYNWNFSNICRSLLTPVTATVTSAPSITLSQTTATICFGEVTPLVTVTGASAYNTFVWSPNTNIVGSVATGFTFQPTVTTTYSLTASQTSGSLCASLLSITVTVKPQPPAITIMPASATICQGSIQALNATLAAPTPVVIYNETFNGANSWTTSNTSTGGTVANASWTLRSSPYTYTSANWNPTLSSNDASRFYFTNSDAQGSASTRTMTYLESPTFSLVGYTSATLSFWHYFRYIGGNKARVEASINGGTWVLVTSFATSRGATSAFVNATADLTPYIGNPAVKIRFFYDATWDYGWAVDNVKITGNLALEVSWSPPTGLFFNAAATTPYIAGTPASLIYTKPSSTTTYTGTALGANGCSTSNVSVVTVQPTPTLGILSSSQTMCASWPPNSLTLVGSIGSIIRWEYATNATFTIGLTAIVNITTTLTAAQIGSFAGTRFYRAVLQNGTCPIVYTNSVFVSFSATTWNGTAWSNGAPTATTKAVFNGNYNSLGDLQACSVEVLSGIINFNSGHTLTVQNNVKVIGGSLTFQNTASLVQVNTLDNTGVQFTNSGNINYKRNSTPVRKFDYTYWSSPVSPQVLNVFSPGTSLFYNYNAAINNWVFSPGTDTMIAGKGYLIRTPDIAPFNTTTTNIFSGSFVGIPTTGTVTIPIVGGGNQVNLIGNPYPCALSANLFLSNPLNVPFIDATIYLWTHNTPITANNYSTNDYAVYNYTGGIGTGTAAINIGVNNGVPNGKIAAGQGFFIKGLSIGNATFTNAMRLVGNNNQFFRMSDPSTLNDSTVDDLERHRFWLDIYNANGAFKQVLIGYIQGGTNNGIDRGFDGELIDVGNVITLYAIQENTKFSIQGRALPFNEADIIPIGYKSTIAGTYQIKLSNFDGLFVTQNIYLEDKLLNVIHDLRTADYSFTTEIGTFNDRFNVLFTNASLATVTPVFDANQVVIYKNQANDFVITTGTTLMSSIKVFDVRGRLLVAQKNIEATQTTFDVGEVNVVLLVQITTVDGVVVTKKVIR